MRLIRFITFLYAALRVSGFDTHHTTVITASGID